MKRKLTGITLCMLLALSLTACTSEKDLPLEVSQQEPEIQSDISKQNSLTVSVCFEYYDIDIAVEQFLKKYPDVDITVNRYDNDYEKYIAQTNVALMSGNAADILADEELSFISYADSGLLADFYSLMENDESFDSSQYFTNVFEGMEYKNGLYVFPLFFKCNQHIGVNSKFSEQLLSSFGSLDTITTKDLMDVYKSLDNKQGFYISETFDATSAVMTNLGNFIDSEAKTCSFDSHEFIQLIKDAHDATNPKKTENDFYISSVSYPSTDSDRSKEYLFADVVFGNFQYFINYEGYEYYENFRPKTDDEGQLLLTTSKAFCIPESSQNKELAWEFIKILTSKEASTFMPDFPIKKDVYKSYISDTITDIMNLMKDRGIFLEGDPQKEHDKAVEYFNKLVNMPMAYPYKYCPSAAITAIVEDMQMFRDGVMTAEQVAADLQNKVSLALQE